MTIRGSKKMMLALAIFTAVGAAATAVGSGSALWRNVPPVYAACGAAYSCVLDPTATSVLDVDHLNDALHAAGGT